MVASFLLFDKLETSSSGPGCLRKDMKTTMNAKNMNSVRTRMATDAMVNRYRYLSGTMDLATCPPSSIAAGSRFSIVTTIPAHPA